MENFISLFTPTAVLSLFASGLLAGALLTEAMVLVPFWRALPPREFLMRHSDMAPLLFRFYAPVTVLGTSLPVITLSMALFLGDASKLLWIVAGLIAIALLGIYFVYFKAANAKFESGKLTDTEVTAELARWANWHNIRTAFACIGFLLSLIALAS